MYIIMERNGFTFAADGCEYVVLDHWHQEVYRDMHKLRAEAKFRELAA